MTHLQHHIYLLHIQSTQIAHENRKKNPFSQTNKDTNTIHNTAERILYGQMRP